MQKSIQNFLNSNPMMLQWFEVPLKMEAEAYDAQSLENLTEFPIYKQIYTVNYFQID